MDDQTKQTDQTVREFYDSHAARLDMGGIVPIKINTDGKVEVWINKKSTGELQVYWDIRKKYLDGLVCYAECSNGKEYDESDECVYDILKYINYSLDEAADFHRNKIEYSRNKREEKI